MRSCINVILALGLTVFSFQAAATSPTSMSVPSSKITLTAAQCAALETALQQYEAFVVSKFGATKLVEALIADANTEVAKLCPANNGFSTTTEYECSVLDSTNSNAVSLGEDSAGNLVNTDTNFKTVCMSQNACNTIVDQKFTVLSSTQTSRCSSSTDQTVIHFTDAQMQTKVTAVP